jgi:putative aldouronate transport system substrate-binding protein
MRVWIQGKTIMITALCMLLLAACSSGNGSNEASPSNALSGNTAVPVQSDAGAQQSEGPVKISILANVLPADAPENRKAFIDVINEKLNVELDFLAPPASGYEQQLQLALISGDIPDVIFFPSEGDDIFINAVNDGVVIPLNDYIEKSENLMKYSYEHSWEALKTLRDGNIYGVPRTSMTRHDGFIVRKDWMDNLGIEVPADAEMTIEQFTDMMRRFTFEDPDGNGVKDTYGFGSYVDANKVLQPVLISELGHYGWQAYEGAEYEYMLPEYDRNSKVYDNILAYTRDLYLEGILDPDSPINDNKTATERFDRGMFGVYKGFAGHVGSREVALKKQVPDAELTYIFVKGPDGEVKGGVYGTGIWGVWAITSKAKDPEKVIEMFDYLLSDVGWDMVSYGIEGVHYKLENGEKVYLPEAGVAFGTQRNIVRRHDDPSFFLRPDSYTKEDVEAALPLIQKAVDAAITSLDQGYTPPAARQPNFMDYKLTWDEKTTRIILGDLPLEEMEKIRDDWYKNSGEQYLKEMNEFIKSMQ